MVTNNKHYDFYLTQIWDQPLSWVVDFLQMLQLQVTELPANGTECDETVNSFCAEDGTLFK